MKGTGAKRNVCPGSYVSTGAKFPVALVESAPMLVTPGYELSVTILNISTLVYVQLIVKRKIVLHGGRS